jgi:site-specific DNA-methyltransferase (adenine-specific)
MTLIRIGGNNDRRVRLWHGDCLDVLKRVPDGSISAVIADPPYGTTGCAWDSVIPFGPMWRELYRVCRPAAPMVFTASQPYTSALIMSNVEHFRHEWIWRKTTGSGFLNVNRGPLKRHENIVVFCSSAVKYNPQMRPGKPYKVTQKSGGGTTKDKSIAGWVTENDGQRYPVSVLDDFTDRENRGDHETEKPTSLMAYLVRTYTDIGETVLDFCMGSGSTGEACMAEGRDFAGIEEDAEKFATARRNIETARIIYAGLPVRKR